MRIPVAIAIAALLGGFPFFAEAASSTLRCVGEDAIVPKGSPGLFEMPASGSGGGKFYVLTSLDNETLKEHSGVWEKHSKPSKDPARVEAEKDALRFAPVRCHFVTATGEIKEEWTEVQADLLVMSVHNLTASKA